MDTASIPYEYFIGQTFKLVDNDSYYVYDEETGKYENNVGIGKAKSDGSEGSSGFNPLSDSESKNCFGAMTIRANRKHCSNKCTMPRERKSRLSAL